MGEDIRIINEPKAVLKQVLSGLPENFKNSVIVVMGNTIIMQQPENGVQKDDPFELGVSKTPVEVLPEVKQFLLTLVKSLPNPKLKNLKRLVIEALIEDMGNQAEVGKYLGLSSGAISHFVWRNKKQKEIEGL
ncbi:MAG: hypothetical protein LUQ65_10310 [Candidatus Helarchaeota archaeon]|nr:hypothetical protein [Candidatus Helarchaeota archaeon]